MRRPTRNQTARRFASQHSKRKAALSTLPCNNNTPAGGWGERLHPDRNTVRETARTGVWLHSSPLQLATASAENGPLYCIAAHGGPDDYFWRLVRGYVHAARTCLDINVRYTSSLDGAEQAAAINQCVADGAVAIASTLADVDAVGDSLRAAQAAGIYVLTFNSGAEHARSVGSVLHIGLDDAAGGRLAGQSFNERGITAGSPASSMKSRTWACPSAATRSPRRTRVERS